MQIISILGQKGGSGKSSMALGLAVQAAMKGRSVAVVDLDPQTTAANWSDRGGQESPAVVSCQVSRLPSVLDTARNSGVKLAIVDTPGKSTGALITAAKVSRFASCRSSHNPLKSKRWITCGTYLSWQELRRLRS